MSVETYYFIVFAVFAFSMGASIASFLNVCIWRLPREESVVSPPSHCPNCNASIRWYQNIPIVSWLALGGKCANCRKPISPRYILVETLGGLLFLTAYLQWGCGAILGSPLLLALRPIALVETVFAYWLVFTGLILGSFIDLDHYYLPDRVTIGGMVIGPIVSAFVPELHAFDVFVFGGRSVSWISSVGFSVAGLAFGFLVLWGLGVIASKAFKKEAMGFGDVKLLGAVGAFFGPVAALFVLIVSSLVGSLTGLVLMLKGKVKLGGYAEIPYGPYISIATVIWMFWGNGIVLWYLSTLTVK